ncbi:hypothetical protein B0J12DRAFT_317119 [Macrophomina phaseolina]|uniref:Secreted protein n=1 Tax=Macrophomina phaseolina TaxID=35725 RepID=A0ABQ8FW47_9PEZI|nr:hypothetical protein B0J12DRAFT_317119 [Macrophomina phaseolina]
MLWMSISSLALSMPAHCCHSSHIWQALNYRIRSFTHACTARSGFTTYQPSRGTNFWRPKQYTHMMLLCCNAYVTKHVEK